MWPDSEKGHLQMWLRILRWEHPGLFRCILHPMTSILKKYTQRKEVPVKMESEIWVNSHKPKNADRPEAEKDQKRGRAVDFEFSIWGLRENTFLLFEATKLVVMSTAVLENEFNFLLSCAPHLQPSKEIQNMDTSYYLCHYHLVSTSIISPLEYCKKSWFPAPTSLLTIS